MTKLEQKISLYGLTMIAAGSCIGSGIFRTPSETANYLPYDSWMLFAWIVGGFITLAGALSIAELGAMYPQAGGIYVYLRKVYGNTAAFLYGWASLTVIVSGSLAAIALVFSSYVASVFPMTESIKLLLALFTIITLSGINILGVKIGNALASFITTAKLIGIFIVIVIGISLGHEHIDMSFELATFQNKIEGMSFLSALGLASIGVFFSYGGFHHASYLAGEVKDAQKTLPRAMIIGTLLVMLVYILINIAYLKLLPIAQIAATDKVASTALATAIHYGSIGIALLIAISTLGTISIYSMSAPRIYYALAADGLFLNKLAEIHPRFHTPANAIAAQCIIGCLILVFWQTFENVINYIVFVDYFFMALAVLGVLILRRKAPDTLRPYKTLGYPIVPLLFVLFTTFVLTVTVIEKPIIAFASAAFMLAGLIIFKVFIKHKN